MKRFIALALAALMLLSAQALAQGTLVTTGTGVVSVPADTATIVLGVEATDPDVLEAQSSVNARIQSIRQALLACGVPESAVTTQNLSIYANYDYSGDAHTIVGYTAGCYLQIRTDDMDNVGALIDAAFAAGANELSSVQFSASDTEAAQQRALALAVKNAAEKAGVMAEAAGLSLGAVERIEEGEANAVYETSGAKRMAMAESAADGAPTFAQGDSQQITATVTVTFGLVEE